MLSHFYFPPFFTELPTLFIMKLVLTVYLFIHLFISMVKQHLVTGVTTSQNQS
jgi:hypothetical protein